MPRRNLTMTEQLDLEEIGGLRVDDEFALGPYGGVLVPIGDNDYLVTHPVGAVANYDNLKDASDALLNKPY